MKQEPAAHIGDTLTWPCAAVLIGMMVAVVAFVLAMNYISILESGCR